MNESEWIILCKLCGAEWGLQSSGCPECDYWDYAALKRGCVYVTEEMKDCPCNLSGRGPDS